MDNNEKKFLKNLSESVDFEMNFNEISSKINYEKYKKEKKPFRSAKKLTLALTSFTLVLSLILVIVIIPNLKQPDNPPDDTTNNTPPNITPGSTTNNVVTIQYDGFIKKAFETNISDRLTNGHYGPLPSAPIIDEYFNINSYDQPSGEIIQTLRFEYIYEVEYTTSEEDGFIGVYLDKKLAEKIYEENKKVIDAPSASPVEDVNGSIVDWFYTYDYYEESKVKWYFCGDAENFIYSEVDGYICVGVYRPQNRYIHREIFSAEKASIMEEIYTTLNFKNDGNEFLTPVNTKLDNQTAWYASNTKIDETNTNMLFGWEYNNKFNCEIDVLNDTIRLETYAVQDEDQLNLDYSSVLKDYYLATNQLIVENENPNKEFGEISYITYKYSDFVRTLQQLAKNK